MNAGTMPPVFLHIGLLGVPAWPPVLITIDFADPATLSPVATPDLQLPHPYFRRGITCNAPVAPRPPAAGRSGMHPDPFLCLLTHPFGDPSRRGRPILGPMWCFRPSLAALVASYNLPARAPTVLPIPA